MNKLNDLLKKYNIKPIGYEKRNSAIIVDSHEGKYVIKKKKKDNSSLLNYLKTRNFDFFPEVIIKDDDYEITTYLENNDIPTYDKTLEIINLISLLHNKTTSYEEIDIDDYKIIYEKINNEITELITYFNNLNDLIDNEIYMSPSNYLLVRNISKIYASLDFCKNELDNWYNLIKDNLKQRKVIINNNLELDHLIRNNSSYLLSWDKAKKDIPIYDIYNLYKRVYKEVEFESLYNVYESKYPLHEEERKLLFIMISLPYKIDFINDEYKNCKRVTDLLDYIVKTEKIISPYYSNQENKE